LLEPYPAHQPLDGVGLVVFEGKVTEDDVHDGVLIGRIHVEGHRRHEALEGDESDIDQVALGRHGESAEVGVWMEAAPRADTVAVDGVVHVARLAAGADAEDDADNDGDDARVNAPGDKRHEGNEHDGGDAEHEVPAGAFFMRDEFGCGPGDFLAIVWHMRAGLRGIWRRQWASGRGVVARVAIGAVSMEKMLLFGRRNGSFFLFRILSCSGRSISLFRGSNWFAVIRLVVLAIVSSATRLGLGIHKRIVLDFATTYKSGKHGRGVAYIDE